MENNKDRIENIINSITNETDISKISEILNSIGLADLDLLLDLLHRENNFERTESLEDMLKNILKPFLSSFVSGKDARIIARFQQRLGFIMKYKSYAIKATTILGYSVFIQLEVEGFSFQRHITHKTEVFQILNKKPNGFVFICDYDLWKQNYNKEIFENWLAGKISNEFYDKYRYEPEPGDVFIIDKLGTVHTVIGCDLIEYATVSTDMVERLYDQNLGKTVPSVYNRSYSNEAIKKLHIPIEYRIVNFLNGEYSKHLIIPEIIQGGKKVVLQNNLFDASIYFIEPRSESSFSIHSDNSKLVHVLEGNGSIMIGEQTELSKSKEFSIKVKVGDIILIPKGIYSNFCNLSSDVFILAEHSINSNTALI